jgi:hypothetical protein
MVVIVRFSKATNREGRTMTTHEFALSDLAARLTGSDASLSTSLRDILAAALQELSEGKLTAATGAAPGEHDSERTALRKRAQPEAGVLPGGRCRGRYRPPAFVYVWLDASYVHVREHRHAVFGARRCQSCGSVSAPKPHQPTSVCAFRVAEPHTEDGTSTPTLNDLGARVAATGVD